MSNSRIRRWSGVSALVLILAEGGLTTSWAHAHARAAAPAAVSLATAGVD